VGNIPTRENSSTRCKGGKGVGAESIGRKKGEKGGTNGKGRTRGGQWAREGINSERANVNRQEETARQRENGGLGKRREQGNAGASRYDTMGGVGGRRGS